MTSHEWARPSRDALVAAVLVYTSGAVTLLYSPYDVAPYSLSAWAVLCVVAVALIWATCMSEPRFLLPDWVAVGALAASSMAFATWYAVWQPVMGPQSDNADALVVGVRQIIDLHNPWEALTFLDNVPSPMMGGYIIAAPFVLAPYGMYLQPLVWFVVLTGFVVRVAGVHAAVMVTCLLVVSPWTRTAAPSGSDHWFMALAVVLAGSWGFWVLLENRATWQWVVSSLALGVALSYRFHVWIVVIPLLTLFMRRFGVGRAVLWFAPAGLVTAVLVLGPLLVNAEAYLRGPVAVAIDKAQEDTVDHSGIIVAAVTLAVTVAATWWVRELPGAWMAATVGLGTMSAMVIVTKVSVVGWREAAGSYEAAAYSGAWLVFGLCALALGRRASVGD